MARGRLTSSFPALRHRNFRRYAVGQTISLAGFWMQSVAQGWLVFRLSGSELALGTVAFVGYLPVLLFSPVAGVVADRVSKYRLILATQTLAMLLAVVQGLVVWTEVATVPIVAGMAFCMGVIGSFDLPTRQSFMVEMVGLEDLPSAIALNASVFNTARVVGPALAGVLVAVAGEAPCFFLNGVSYLAALWALLGMHLPAARPRAGAGRASGLRSGLAYVRHRPVLASLLGTLGLVSALALQSNVLMPSLAERVFGRGARGFGVLLTAYGVGAVITALRLASRTYSAVEQRRNLLLGLWGMATGLLVVAASPSYPMALVGQLVAGFGMLRYTATTNVLVQTLTEDPYRGRVMGIHTMMFAGAAPFGALALGSLARAIGPQPTLVVSGAGALAAAMWLATRPRFP
ncbi:MAG TPA: MFS transporter [Candidatus Eisenbacteria bacterium]|nr:MFS transporter [Candidatus Eisenbacteria bacterium]